LCSQDICLNRGKLDNQKRPNQVMSEKSCMSESPVNKPGPATCHQCGEQQLGSANRCWKCGTVLVSRFSNKKNSKGHDPFPQALNERPAFVASQMDDVYEAEILEALVLDDDAEGHSLESNAPHRAETHPTASGALQVNPQATPVRPYQQDAPLGGYQPPAAHRPQPGNPFQMSNWPAAVGHPHQHPVPELPVWMPGHELFAARGGAVAALLLGVMAIFGGYFTGMAMFNALIGMGLGAWGLNSQRKRTAQVGMVLCIIGLVTSMLFIVLRW
jgi:hypothetical protein